MVLELEFDELYKLSINEPEKFWDEHAKNVFWHKTYTRVLEDKESPFPKWFVEGEINMSYNCLDRQVQEGYGNDVAVIYESPLRSISQKITYKELLNIVELLAGVLVDKCGVKKGDRVLFYFPKIPQYLIGMLACTRIGAIYTSIYGGFSPKEASTRIKHYKPKVIFTTNVEVSANGVTNCKEKIDLTIKLSEFQPDFCIVYNLQEYEAAKMISDKDLNWEIEILRARPQPAIPLESNHPMHVSYTSGTTGNPKPFVFETGGAVVDYKTYLKYHCNVKSNETILIISSFHWILGQSILSHSPLMSRNPTIIYEGKPSSRSAALQLLRILKEHKAVIMLCTPTIIRSILTYCNEEDFSEKFDNLRGIFLGGETHDSYLDECASKAFKCPVYNVWGQTETGGFGISPCLGYNIKSSTSAKELKSVLIPGVHGKIVDRDTGKDLPDGRIGRFILKLPLTPSRSATMLDDNTRFFETCFKKFPGYYDTLDAAVVLQDNSLKIVSRDDDIIHVEATGISGTSIEDACLKSKDLEQAAVVALDDPIKGSVPFGFLVPTKYNKCNEKEIIDMAVKNVLEVIGEVASFQKAVIVPNLPRNISGKILKNSLESMINGRDFKMPITVENGEIYKVIYDILCQKGFYPSIPVD